MSKCPSCPIAGACIAERPGYEFACKFADGSDSERAWLANQSARAQGKPIPDPIAFQPCSAQPPVPAPAGPSRLQLLSAAAQCPHRVAGAAACGCGHKARCTKYNKDVTLAECGDCVAAGLDD